MRRAANAAFPTDTFDLVLSHEVLEHVQDDRQAIAEIVRTLRRVGLVLFCPTVATPFETHRRLLARALSFWQRSPGELPAAPLARPLAPHVRVTPRRPGKVIRRFACQMGPARVIFGAYDTSSSAFPAGRWLRAMLQGIEKTPLQGLGLSHFWVVEKTN